MGALTVIVPLAGPDFERSDGSIKTDSVVNGVPLLQATLERRPWWTQGQAGPEDLVFVLKGTERALRFADDILKVRYPGASVVTVSHTTGGAALSALAGIAQIADSERPVCVDLVDIAYRSTFNPKTTFADRDIGGVALVFTSNSPMYSYLRTDADGTVVHAAEKKVISNQASAGTYFFANPAAYIGALVHNLTRRDEMTHRGLFFVCPLFNGVISNGRRVALEAVSDVVDIKTDISERSSSSASSGKLSL